MYNQAHNPEVKQTVMDDLLLSQIRESIRVSQRILVSTHVRPDGDAIGSMLGLGLSLRAAGKEVQMVLSDGVPMSMRHLEGSKQILQEINGAFDFSITVDCSDSQRIGSRLKQQGEPDLNIDHHPTNENFGKYNLIDASASATAEILAELLPLWDLPISVDVASALLTGLITDTIGFRTSSVTSRTMRIAAQLIDRGADISQLYLRALVFRSYESTKFWGAGLSQLERDGPIVWTKLTIEDRKNAGYKGRDDADLINVLTAIKDAAIAVIFVEQPGGSVKVSWRAQPGFDVARLALRFGGGGHVAAAGAELNGTMDEVMSRVLHETYGLLVN
jgi:bifunctional oligoribonuclease and PAP phosphatase NrnA